MQRVPIADANIPRIPVVPLSYGDAKHILAELRGQAVPDAWKVNRININIFFGDELINTEALHTHIVMPLSYGDAKHILAELCGQAVPDAWKVNK